MVPTFGMLPVKQKVSWVIHSRDWFHGKSQWSSILAPLHAHHAYFKAFLPVLANEREARLQRTLDEVDHALTIIREPKSSRQERMARIREAKVLVMQKLLRGSTRRVSAWSGDWLKSPPSSRDLMRAG